MGEVGVDVIQVSRIRKAIDRHGESFLLRIYTESEIKYCDRFRNSIERLAARWAAKEAVFKALGTGVAGARWKDVEIINARSGRPRVLLHGDARRRAERQGYNDAKISISHSGDIAVAFALLQ